MTEIERQMHLHRDFHTELSELTKKYLGQGLWRTLTIGAIEDVKIVAIESYLQVARNSAEKDNPYKR